MHHRHLPAAAGGLGALATLPLHLLLPPAASVQLAAVIVAVIGAIYAGFALQAGSVRQVIVECAVAGLFCGAALAGLWWSPWIIPAAYLAHGAWDALHHRHAQLGPTPIWYPPFCAVYDWIFALGLAAIWRWG